MKKFLVLLLLVPFSAFAHCPTFEREYINCQSQNSGIHEISVKAKEPFYKLTFHRTAGDYRMYLITDGELRDVTIQSQDGEETNYSESSRCRNGQVIVRRTLRDSLEREEIIFTPSKGQIIIDHFSDGVLTEQTQCFAPN